MFQRSLILPLTLAVSALLCLPAHAMERRHGVLVGTVLKTDAAAKTLVVKLADGSEHTFHFLKKTAVHGGDAVAAGARDAFHGLKEGSEVAVHYSARGAEETAEEVDRVGKDGLRSTEATVTSIDRGAKKLTVKTADGSEETYKLTANAARSAGKEIAAGTEKGSKVTVYYTEQAGHKIAHFFQRAI